MEHFCQQSDGFCLTDNGTSEFDNVYDRDGAYWKPSEVEHLADEYESGLSIPEIADNHNRTEKSIRMQLKKMGKISN